MQTTNNTVLITGGGSGIGFETARLFAEKGNTVIITGRDANKLQKAAAQLPNTTAIVVDNNDAVAVEELVTRIKRDFPKLNILINNAGRAFAYTLSAESNAYEKASEEFSTNFLSAVRLIEKLLPVLSAQPEAAIINISSIVSFVPGLLLPTYSASKAALHSYTQTLRVTLQQNTNIKVFEVMPPLVDTEFAKELKGTKISPEQVAADTLHGLDNNIYEIHVGATAALYQLFLSSPQKALLHLNGIEA